jgi:hypothetical protein
MPGLSHPLVVGFHQVTKVKKVICITSPAVYDQCGPAVPTTKVANLEAI